MRDIMGQLSGHLRSVAKPPAILFGVALLHFVVTYVWVIRWRQEFGGGPYASGWDAGVLLTEPFLLLFSSGMLLVSAWWCRLLSLAVSLWLLYFLGFGGLLAVSNAHDLPLFSAEVARRWLYSTWLMQSQVFVQLALACAINVYGLASFYDTWRRRWRHVASLPHGRRGRRS